MSAEWKSFIDKRYVIIGLGQIGCSLAAALRNSDAEVYIHGIDLYWKRYYRSLLNSFSKKLKIDIDDVLIIICTPLKAAVEICLRLINQLTPRQLVVTTGSLLQPFFSSEFKLHESWRRAFIAGHPFAGTTYSGKKAVQAKLFLHRPFFYSHFAELTAENRRRFFVFLKHISARPRQIAPEEHDSLMAAVSNFPAILAYLLFSQVATRSSLRKEFLGSGFFKTSSLVLTPVDVIADIINLNWQNIEAEISKFILQLKLFQERVPNFKEEFLKINTLAETLRRNYEKYFRQSEN